jgi:hypothetical protein
MLGKLDAISSLFRPIPICDQPLQTIVCEQPVFSVRNSGAMHFSLISQGLDVFL